MNKREQWIKVADEYENILRQKGITRFTAKQAATWAWKHRREVFENGGIDGGAKYLGNIFGERHRKWGSTYEMKI